MSEKSNKSELELNTIDRDLGSMAPVYLEGGTDLLARRWVSIGTICILILLVNRMGFNPFINHLNFVLLGGIILWSTVRYRSINRTRLIILVVLDIALVMTYRIVTILVNTYSNNDFFPFIRESLHEYPGILRYILCISLVGADLFMAKIVLPENGKVLDAENRSYLSYGPPLLVAVAIAAAISNFLLIVLTLMQHFQSGNIAGEDKLLKMLLALPFSIAATAPLIWFVLSRRAWALHTTWIMCLFVALPLWFVLDLALEVLGLWFVLIFVALSDSWTTALRGKQIEEQTLISIRKRLQQPLTRVAWFMIGCAGLGVLCNIQLTRQVMPTILVTSGLASSFIWLPLGIVGFLYICWERASLRSQSKPLVTKFFLLFRRRQ